MKKDAAGIMVYLTEELGDARLRLSQVKNYVVKALELVNNSEQKNHFYEEAGHIIENLPTALFKAEKALDAASLAASKIDYEEIKQGLTPEKVSELEEVLENVRFKQLRKFSSVSSESEVLLKNIISSVVHTGKVSALDMQRFMTALEQEDRLVSSLELDAGAGEEFQKVNPKITDEEVEEINKQHEKNKDRFKASGLNPQLISRLKQNHWQVKANAEIPHATSKDGTIRYWFTPKGLFKTTSTNGARHDLKSACKVKNDFISHQEIQSRYEKGKPADPTENMSEDDKKVWEEMNEKYKDKIKDLHK